MSLILEGREPGVFFGLQMGRGGQWLYRVGYIFRVVHWVGVPGSVFMGICFPSIILFKLLQEVWSKLYIICIRRIESRFSITHFFFCPIFVVVEIAKSEIFGDAGRESFPLKLITFYTNIGRSELSEILPGAKLFI